MRQKREKNRGLMLFCICCNTFCFGGLYAWSAFSGELAAYMGWEYSQVTFAYSLQLIADTYTVTTKNTFIRITHDGRRTEINRLLLSVVVVSYTGHAKTVCQSLQITVTALDAGSTVSAVGSQ